MDRTVIFGGLNQKDLLMDSILREVKEGAVTIPSLRVSQMYGQ